MRRDSAPTGHDRIRFSGPGLGEDVDNKRVAKPVRCEDILRNPLMSCHSWVHSIVNSGFHSIVFVQDQLLLTRGYNKAP